MLWEAEIVGLLCFMDEVPGVDNWVVGLTMDV